MNKPFRPAKVRQATKRDIPALIELNRAAYPGLAVENVVWGEAHLLSHQRMFPEGQWLAEVGGKIVGAVADAFQVKPTDGPLGDQVDIVMKPAPEAD